MILGYIVVGQQTYGAGTYFENEGNKKVKAIQIKGRIAYIKYERYQEFKNSDKTSNENSILSLIRVLPTFSDISRIRKMNIIKGFTELSVKKGAILEHQGQKTEHLYWIIRGEVYLHRRILGLYPENELT